MVNNSKPTGKGSGQGRDKGKSLLDSALEYLRRGWSVIPTKGKKPACPWKQFQTRRASEAEIKKLFRKPGVDGLAVVFGPVSGGIACRDFDDEASYEAWKRKYPKTAKLLPTVKTARGYHVYFLGPEGFKDFGNGEYRGDSGHYCLLPPSRHPDGVTYKWVVPLLDNDIPRIDPYKKGLMGGVGVGDTQRTQRTQRTHVGVWTEGTTSTVSSVFPVFPGISRNDQKVVQDAILASQPEKAGQRHQKVFALCRHLKAIPSLANADNATLRPIVEEWHRRATPTIRTKPFSDTWVDFLSGWTKVKAPIGEGAIDEAFREAKKWESWKKERQPLKAANLYPDEPNVVLLAALCKVLQRRAGKETFFLDCRTAGRLLGVTHKQAWSWLAALCGDGILERVSLGSLKTHRANEYRYVAGKQAKKKGGK